MYNLSLLFFFSSRMFEPTFSLFRHFVYLDLSRNLLLRSSHSLRLSRHFEHISILVGNFGHVILLCARVFSRTAAILKSEKTLGTRLRNNGKKVFATLWQICVFVTDSKIYQSLNYYLKKYQNESLDKGFIQQINWVEHGFTYAIQNTHSRLVSKAHLHPKGLVRCACCFMKVGVTGNCFWAGFLLKSVSTGAILSKIVQKHAGIYSSIIRLLFPGIILWLSRPNVFFSLLLRPIYFLPNDTSQLKILYGYAEGKYCQYSSQRSLCYEAKKQIFYESLIATLFKLLIVLDALIWFYSCDVNRAARECVINE